MFTVLLQAGMSAGQYHAMQWYNDDILRGVVPGVCLAQTTDNFLCSPPFLSNMEPCCLTETLLPPGLPPLVVTGEAKL